MESKTFFQKLSTGVTFNKKRILDVNNIFKFKRQKQDTSENLQFETNENGDASKKNESVSSNSQEKIQRLRKESRLHVWGSDIPNPATSFEELSSEHNLSPVLKQNIAAAGYDVPTPIQMQAIPVMLYKREILACAPTGSGKTAAFLIPLIHHLKGPKKKSSPRALIVVPTRELAQQTRREFDRLSQGTHLKGLVIEKASNLATQLARRGATVCCDILITTPKKLIFLLKQETPVLTLNKVEWLVVDESDKLFEAGSKGFRDQLGAIYKSCECPCIRRALFSATFSCEVQDWCKMNLDNLVTVSVGLRNSAVESVRQELVFVGSESGKLLAIRDLIRKGITPPVLVFVQSKLRAQELFRELVYDGVNVEVIHADRTQTQRDSVVKAFRSGRIWVLLCTELMGRGIDFKGVSLVLNYDLPLTSIAYIHQIGRTGRAGRQGHAITFFTEGDIPNLRSIAQVMRGAGCDVPDFMLSLKKQNKNERRKLAKKAPSRETISTDPRNNKKSLRKKVPAKLEEKNANESTSKKNETRKLAKKAPSRETISPDPRDKKKSLRRST